METLIFSSIITGIGFGSMYGLLALGFYITYSVSQTVTFSRQLPKLHKP